MSVAMVTSKRGYQALGDQIKVSFFDVYLLEISENLRFIIACVIAMDVFSSPPAKRSACAGVGLTPLSKKKQMTPGSYGSVCEFCSRVFNYSHSLKRHLKTCELKSTQKRRKKLVFDDKKTPKLNLFAELSSSSSENEGECYDFYDFLSLSDYDF